MLKERLMVMDVYAIGMSAGLGIMASAVFFIAYTSIKRKLYFTLSTSENKKRAFLDIVKGLMPDTSKGVSKEDKNAMVAGTVGSLLLAILGIGTNYLFILAVVGLLIGAVACKGLYSFRRTAELYSRKCQVAVLFEAVEMYLRANMSLVQALYAAKSLTPLLNDAVRSCIVRWPSNPENALENLRKDIGVPEADVLVSLLHRINITGMKNLEGVIQREAQNIDQLRNVATRMKISSRPMYFMLHRVLPVVSILGMFLGSMFYHLSKSMQAAGISF